MKAAKKKNTPVLALKKKIINLLGVVYAHKKTSNEGDLYLTRYGLKHAELLEIENWYEKKWFESQRLRLAGTSSVFRVPTKKINGKKINIVVKNCRVGEDVPVDTHTLYEFLNTEFNSPWEEFSLVMEMREGKFGPKGLNICTQLPLAIYVPPERLQEWQTGRSRDKINKITHRHPGIDLDILRQYKLVYQWIEGLNIIEAFNEIGISDDILTTYIWELNAKVTEDMKKKGYIVADMKPSHVIINETQIEEMRKLSRNTEHEKKQKVCADYIRSRVKSNNYSIVDYELLQRTSEHETDVKNTRRHLYLDDQRDRFVKSHLPPFLCQSEIFDVPYVHGHTESTGGLLWVVGRNPHLFDFFLPERWRRTPCHQLSNNQEIYYTITKDNIHIVWKTSRVGEKAPTCTNMLRSSCINERGYNSPFEEFGIAQYLSDNGVPTVYIRAIYMTGTTRIETMIDPRHYGSHNNLFCIDEEPVLREDRNYITIRGFYNGPDSWVASHNESFYTSYDLIKAINNDIIKPTLSEELINITRSRLRNLNYDGTFLEPNDIIISTDHKGKIVLDKEGIPEARICNFELIYKI
ncbi:hypothetical protein ACFL6P_01955 [Candidatus Latescibacterota bacterium]